MKQTPSKPSFSLLGINSQFELVISFTLILLLLYPHASWYIKIPLSVFSIAGFIFPALRHSKVFWFAISAIIILGTVLNWVTLDNHKYLLGYWCIALACALSTQSPMKVLNISAHWLIILVFALGVLHKITTTNYLNASFFYYELLFDPRFNGLAKYLGGIPDHINEFNHAARKALVNYDSKLISVELNSSKGVNLLALFITWWNLLIQAVIAIAFINFNQYLYKLRHFFLLLFLFTTYLFAPVVGFGWTLAIIGLAQLEENKKRTLLMYLSSFLFLQIYRIPWQKILELVNP